MAHDNDTLDVEHLFFLQLRALESKQRTGAEQPVPPGPLAIYLASHPAAGPDEPPADAEAEPADDRTTGTDATIAGEWDGPTLELPRTPVVLPWMWHDMDD